MDQNPWIDSELGGGVSLLGNATADVDSAVAQLNLEDEYLVVGDEEDSDLELV